MEVARTQSSKNEMEIMRTEKRDKLNRSRGSNIHLTGVFKEENSKEEGKKLYNKVC